MTACHPHQCPAQIEGTTLLALSAAIVENRWAYTAGVFQTDGNDRHWCPAHITQAP